MPDFVMAHKRNHYALSLLLILSYTFFFFFSATCLAEFSQKDKTSSISSTFAVVGFPTHAPGTGNDWLGVGLGEDLSTRLSQVEGIFPVERLQINLLMASVNMNMLAEGVSEKGGKAEDERLKKIGDVLKGGSFFGASRIIIGSLIMTGSYGDRNSTLVANARVVDAETGRITKAVSVTGTGDAKGYMRLQEDLAEALAEKMNIPLEKRVRVLELKHRTASSDAYEAFCKARKLLYEGKYAEAIEMCQKSESLGVASIFEQLRKTEKDAVEELRKRENDPKKRLAYSRAFTQRQEERKAEKKEHLAMEVFNLGEGLRMQGEDLELDKKKEDARKAYTKAIECYDEYFRLTRNSDILWRLPVPGAESMHLQGNVLIVKKWHGVLGIDTSSGKILWDKPGEMLMDSDGNLATAGNLLFTTRYDETIGRKDLTVYDMVTGESIWTKEGISNFAGHEIFVVDGVTFCVVEENVIRKCESVDYSTHCLVALDASTGKEKWHVSGETLTFTLVKNSSVFPKSNEEQEATFDGSMDGVIFVATEGRLSSLNADTGETIWNKKIANLSPELLPPKICGDAVQVHVSSGEQINEEEYVFVSAKTGDILLEVPKRTSDDTREEFITTNGTYAVFWNAKDQEFKAKNLESERWTTLKDPHLPFFSRGRESHVSFLPKADLLQFITDGWIDVADLQNGETVWKGHYKNPVRMHEKTICEYDSDIRAIDTYSGKSLWQFGSKIDGQAAILSLQGNILWIKIVASKASPHTEPSTEATIFGIDIATGTIIFKTHVDAPLNFIKANKDRIYISWGDHFRVFRRDSNRDAVLVFQYTTDGGIGHSPLLLLEDRCLLFVGDGVVALNTGPRGTHAAVVIKAEILSRLGRHQEAFRIMAREFMLNASRPLESLLKFMELFKKHHLPFPVILRAVEDLMNHTRRIPKRRAGNIKDSDHGLQMAIWCDFDEQYAIGLNEKQHLVAFDLSKDEALWSLPGFNASPKFFVREGQVFSGIDERPACCYNIQGAKAPLFFEPEYDISSFVLDGNSLFILLEKATGRWANSEIRAYDIETGIMQWLYKFGYPEDHGNLELSNGVLLSTLRSQFGETRKVCAIRATDGRMLWERGGNAAWLQKDTGRVYIESTRGFIEALSLKTGHVQWQRIVKKSDIFPMKLENGLLLIPSEQGTIVALDTESGQLLWEKPVGHISLHWADFQSEGDFIWFQLEQAIQARHRSTGEFAWQCDMLAKIQIGGISRRHDDVIYTLDEDNRLSAVDAGSGTLRWSSQVAVPKAGSVSFEPAFDRILVKTPQALKILHPEDGRLLWIYHPIESVEKARLTSQELFVADGSILRKFPYETLHMNRKRLSLDWENKDQLYALLIWGRSGLALRKLYEGYSLWSVIDQCALDQGIFADDIRRLLKSPSFTSQGYLALDPEQLRPLWVEGDRFFEWLSTVVDDLETMGRKQQARLIFPEAR
jgi:outer membrane protein assembly factor BamB